MGARTLKFADVLLSDYVNAFLTIYDYGDGSMICEGTVRSLAKIVNIRKLGIRSLFVMELEDGSIQADIHVSAGKEAAV